MTRTPNATITKRQSNMELLRILAMFLVLLVHANYFSLGSPNIHQIQNESLDAILRIFFEAISIVCVNVFILISGWFGIKPTFKGLSNFIYQCLFFLTGLYMITIFIGVNEISLHGIAGCIFATPLNWFIKAYLLLYLLSPVLNAFIRTTSQRTFKLVLISYFAFTCTYGWIGSAAFMNDGYTTLFFIGLYLLARYSRIYTPNWVQYSSFTYFAIYFACVAFVTSVSFLVPYFGARDVPYNLYSYISPTTIIGALALLLCFAKIKIQNRFINWCGKSCFAVFLMHVSPSTLWHFKSMFIYLHDNLQVLVFWAATFVILSIIFIIYVLIDKVRIITYDFLYIHVFNKLEVMFNKYK